jgi:PAS domain S-box-containing protein
MFDFQKYYTGALARYFCICLALGSTLLYQLSASATDKVRLQLKWQHQFQFAGYYAAQEQGFYKAAGLDVEIIPGRQDEDTVQQVLQGKAEFGVSTTDLLPLREQGAPVVVLAVIFQHSPMAIMTLKKSGLQSIHDLAGCKFMSEPGVSELYAYLNKEGISADKLTLVPYSFNLKDLLDGKVDAVSTYVTDEPFELDKAGYEYMLYSPRAVGIDFYGDNLFTTERQLRRNPELVKAFRQASLKGWEYAMKHQEELVQLIYSSYTRRHSVEHLRFEAGKMVPLLQTGLVEIGHMNPGRWGHISETYAELGMMKPDFNLKGFLYDPHPAPSKSGWLYLSLCIAALIISAISALTIYIHRINARLRQEAEERSLAEEELRKSEERYRILTENIKDVVWILDVETMYFRYVSPSVERLRGYTPEEIISVPMTHALTAEDAANLIDHIRSQADDILSGRELPGKFYTNEVEQPCKDGSTVWTEVIASYYINKENGRMEVRGVTRDITERKRIEEIQNFLAQTSSGTAEEPFFNALARFLAHKLCMDFVCIDRLEGDGLTARTVAVWCDGHFEDNVTYALKDTPCGDVVGKTVCCFPANVCQFFPRDQVLRDLRAESYAGVTVFDHTGKPVGLIAVIGRNPLKNRPLAEATLKMVGVRVAGELERLGAEAEKTKLEEQNRHLQKAESLSRMSGSVAHHFNNQLQIVMGYLGMVINELPPGDSRVAKLAEAMRATQKASEVSGNLLAYIGQKQVKLEFLDLAELCRMSLPILLGGKPEKVTMETDLPSPGPGISADSKQIQQILTSLVINAWESIGDGAGNIRLSVGIVSPSDIPTSHRFPLEWRDMDKSYACLEIKDSGCGIKKEDIDKLFDPFFSTKFTGRGLGLSVVLGIVRMHAAVITVESRINEGSVFSVFFPVSAQPAQRQSGQDVNTPNIPLDGIVLLVEDESALCEMLRIALIGFGFRVLQARDGVEAVEIFKEHKDEISCMLCDLTMPRMNGWETISALRALRHDLPVILASGYDEARAMAGKHAELPDFFLNKPYDIRKLADTIRRAIAQRAAKRETDDGHM